MVFVRVNYIVAESFPRSQDGIRLNRYASVNCFQQSL